LADAFIGCDPSAAYNACVRETVADAVRQIQAPALAALEK